MSRVELGALVTLQAVATDIGLEIVLIGALARQIIFDNQVIGEPYRATGDLDAVVRVESWDQFDLLLTRLAKVGFTPVSDKRLEYSDGTEVDLLPFGGVEDAEGNLSRSADRPISLRGVSSATRGAERRQVEGVEISVVNLPGLMALKLVAFRDRRAWERKDLADIAFILERATDYFGSEPYRELEGPLLAEFEYDQVGPFYLGKLVARISADRELVELSDIVDRLILAAPQYRDLAIVAGPNLNRIINLFEVFGDGLKAERTIDSAK